MTIDPERDFDVYISLGSVIKPEAAPVNMPPLASSDLDGVDSLTPQPPHEAPWADVSTNFCGCRSLKEGMESYLSDGRGPFTDRHFTKPRTTSLYAASLAWVVGEGQPSARLAYREPCSRGVLRGAGARLSECQRSLLPRPTKWSPTSVTDKGQRGGPCSLRERRRR